MEKPGILNSNVIAELRESKLTVSEFAKRFGMIREENNMERKSYNKAGYLMKIPGKSKQVRVAPCRVRLPKRK